MALFLLFFFFFAKWWDSPFGNESADQLRIVEKPIKYYHKKIKKKKNRPSFTISEWVPGIFVFFSF